MKDRQALQKIYQCIKSCNTIEQFNNAFFMLFRASARRSNENIQLLLFVQDYALAKGKQLLINK